MDGDLEYRPDHSQHPDGRFITDLIAYLMKALIIVGGFYNIGLIVFHLLFWRIFNWEHDLRRVSYLNRATMQVLNISLTFAFIIFSYISLAHTTELLTTSLGHSLLVLMALFWLARSIQQILFYKLHHWGSWAFLFLFLSGCLLYAIPAISVIQQMPQAVS